jgi:hypothetical protein
MDKPERTKDKKTPIKINQVSPFTMRSLVHRFFAERTLSFIAVDHCHRLHRTNWSDVESRRRNSKIGTITPEVTETYNALTVEMGQDFGPLPENYARSYYRAQDVHAIVLEGQARRCLFSWRKSLDWLRSQHNSVHQNVTLCYASTAPFLVRQPRSRHWCNLGPVQRLALVPV